MIRTTPLDYEGKNLAKRWRRIAAARIAWAEFILGKGE